MTQARRDINELPATELADYVHALDILRARSAANPDDETGYDFQAALHNDSEIGPCEHGNDLFMPWHRAHLYYFEKLLQASDPPRTSGVTIPYWDWLHPEAGEGKFPAPFYGDGLRQSDRDETAEQLPSNTLQILLKVKDQQQFVGYPKDSPNGDYGDLELGPHNWMHSDYVGGKMAAPWEAALDPIYWSFHCFIDLLWDAWQSRNGDPELTSPDSGLRGFTGLAMDTAGAFRRTADLGYHYELTPRLQALFATPLPDEPPHSLLWAGSLRPLFEESLSASLRDTASADFAIPAAASSGRKLRIRLDALKVPLTGSYSLFAYVHPRDLPFDPENAEFARWSVGYVSLWLAHRGGHGHHGHGGSSHHHPSTATVRFDATEALSGQRLTDMVMTLHYRPAANQPPEAGSLTDLVEEVELSDVLLEVFD